MNDMLKSEQIKSAAAERELVIALNENTQMTHQEIADHLGISKNRVRHHVAYDRVLKARQDVKQPA